jgi:hypothetical protein
MPGDASVEMPKCRSNRLKNEHNTTSLRPVQVLSESTADQAVGDASGFMVTLGDQDAPTSSSQAFVRPIGLIFRHSYEVRPRQHGLTAPQGSTQEKTKSATLLPGHPATRPPFPNAPPLS